MDFRHKVGANLKRIRMKVGVSQETLAHRSQVHRTQISKYERGEVEPTAESLAKLSFALNVDAQDFFAGARLTKGSPPRLVVDDNRRRTSS